MEENANFIPEIYIGENGNWFLGDTDTGVAPQAQKETKVIPVRQA